VISEGSCDTEYWSNDAENSRINHTLLYIHIENSLNCHNILKYYCFCCSF